jgi:hypothetical protein
LPVYGTRLANRNRWWGSFHWLVALDAISFRQQSLEEQMRHNLKIAACPLIPYATDKGAPEIRVLLETV